MKTYRAALVSIITAMTLIVSGCSGGDSAGGKVDEALLAKCEILRANLAKLTYTPEFANVEDVGETFNYLSLAATGFISGNLGVKSRAAARKLIIDNHPYIADYLSQAAGDEYSLDNAIRLAILEKAIEGTITRLHSMLDLPKKPFLNPRVQLARAYFHLSGKKPPGV